MKSRSLVVLLAAAPLLFACGSASDQSAQPVPSSASAVPSASSASPGEASPSASGSTTPRVIPPQVEAKGADVCAVLSVAKLNQLMGSDLSTTSGGKNGLPCSYLGKRGTKVGADVGVLTGITLPAAATLEAEAKTVGAKYGLTKVSAVQVEGAQNAYQVTGESQGIKGAAVIAEQDGVIYEAIGGGSRSSATYATGLVKVVSALIAA